MRKIKKIAALFLTAAMTMSLLAGCGGNDDTSSEESTETTEEVSEETSETEEATEEDTEESTETTGVSDGDHVVDLNFDDGDVDGFLTYINGGDATISNVDGELCVEILSTGTLDYANQIYYDGFELYEGCVYEYSFDVHCDIDRKIEWRLQINSGDYHAYAIDVIDIGSETQHISVQFTMEEDSDPAPRLCFNMGKAEGMTGDEDVHHIYFDNILLEVVDASNAQQIESLPEALTVNINQVGYEPNDEKVATVSDKNAESFEVVDTSTGETVYTGELGDVAYDVASSSSYKHADFSSVTEAGTYKIVLDTGEESFEFEINDSVYDSLYSDVILMLYNQRCGTELDSSISGDYAHAACHTGEAVIYGTDTTIDVSGGWHDAGDYGRYVVSGAKTVQDLLLTYEDAGETSDNVGIPESGNGIPDILDEVKYELDWMLKMQDSSSGGVYHKVTCEVFPETVMPEEETDQLIVFPISNTATGDFAAVMAKASVIFEEYDPDYAGTCLEAAMKAYEYLIEHKSDAGFSNPENVETGEYPDSNCNDEILWAAVELYAATGDSSYKDDADELIEGDEKVNYGLGWADVGYYALYDYIKYDGGTDAAKDIILSEAESIADTVSGSGYGVSLVSSFPWGSNMTVANNGLILLMANSIESNEDYITYAQYQRDYLLGRNSVSYCYVTGYGTRSPLDTHHRPSQVVGASMTGMLVGGADSDLEDSYAKAVLTGLPAESCYADNSQSYSCNEVTIYWNSPLIYLLAKLESTK